MIGIGRPRGRGRTELYVRAQIARDTRPVADSIALIKNNAVEDDATSKARHNNSRAGLFVRSSRRTPLRRKASQGPAGDFAQLTVHTALRLGNRLESYTTLHAYRTERGRGDVALSGRTVSPRADHLDGLTIRQTGILGDLGESGDRQTSTSG